MMMILNFFFVFEYLSVEFVHDQVHRVIHIAIVGLGEEVFAFQVERDFSVIS